MLRIRSTSNSQSPTPKEVVLAVGNWKLGVCLLLVLLHASAAAAHHTFAAEYDGKKSMTLSGTVTKVEWTNPHVHFFLDVKDSTGATTQWEFTMGAVNGLFRRGWKTSMMKAGEAAGPERWTAMEGGCPIIADGECIGGIGIADGEWATDARIAQRAVEAIGASHGG